MSLISRITSVVEEIAKDIAALYRRAPYPTIAALLAAPIFASAGTILTTADGHTYQVVTGTGHLQTANGVNLIVKPQFEMHYNVRSFNPVANGTTNDITVLQRAHNVAILNGYPVYYPPGSYLIGGRITHNLGQYFTNENDELGVSILGAGSGVTEIRLQSTNSGITVTGDHTTGSGAHGHTSIKGIKLSGAGTGLIVEKLAFMEYHDLFFYQTIVGFQGNDILSSRFYNCRWRWNTRSVLMQRTNAFSYPNSVTFYGCQIGQSAEYGMRIIGGSQISIIGGSFEKCGLTGTSGIECAIRIENAGAEGGVGLNVTGVYFEGNKGDADVVIVQGVYPTVYAFTGCNFNRLGNTNYTNRNILLVTSAGDLAAILTVTGCSFRGYGGYVEDATRPYIQIQDVGNCAVFNDQGNHYNSVLAYPQQKTGQVYAQVSFNGTLATPTVGISKNVTSIVKNGTGDYTINFSVNMPNDYDVFVQCGSVGSLGYWFGKSNSFVRVRTRTLADAAADYANVQVLVVR